MILNGDKFTKSGDGTLVAEISDLQLSSPPQSMTIINIPKEGQQRSFTLVGFDVSGGDVAGWRYTECDGPNRGRSWEDGHPPKTVEPICVLIIND